MFKILISGNASSLGNNFTVVGADSRPVVATHPCPVCGYGLNKPASDFTICPSCGVEFGYSDVGVSHRELRLEWISFGAPWSSVVVHRPYAWNPWDQLIKANFAQDLPWRNGVTISENKESAANLFALGSVNQPTWTEYE